MKLSDYNLKTIRDIAEKLEISNLDQHPYDLYQLCLSRVRGDHSSRQIEQLRRLAGIILPPNPFPPDNEVPATVRSVELYINALREYDYKRLVAAIDQAHTLKISALDGFRKSHYLDLTDSDFRFLRENTFSILEEFSKIQVLRYSTLRVGTIEEIDDYEEYQSIPGLDIEYLYTHPELVDYAYFSSDQQTTELYGVLKDNRPFLIWPIIELKRIK